MKIIENQIYYIEDVERMVNRNRLTLRRWWMKGNFPKPILLADKRCAWHISVIHEWMNKTFSLRGDNQL